MDYLTALMAAHNANPLEVSTLTTSLINGQPSFLAGILPTQSATTDEIRSGAVQTIVARAKATAMDSPFAKGGGMQISEGGTKTVKFTIEHNLTESNRQALNGLAVRSPNSVLPRAVDYLIGQGIVESLRLAENYVRAQVLTGTTANFKENGVVLSVGTGLRDQNIVDRKTDAKGSWTGPNSKMWEDVVSHGQKTRQPGQVVALMSPAKFMEVRANPVNKLRVISTESAANGDPFATRYVVGKVSETVNGQDVQADETFTVVTIGTPEQNADGSVGAGVWSDKKITLVTRGTAPVTLEDGTVVRGPLGSLYRGPNLHAPTAGFIGVYTRIYRPEANTAEIRAQGSEYLAGWVQNSAAILVLDHA